MGRGFLFRSEPTSFTTPLLQVPVPTPRKLQELVDALQRQVADTLLSLVTPQGEQGNLVCPVQLLCLFSPLGPTGWGLTDA